jgi:hypothetical protein
MDIRGPGFGKYDAKHLTHVHSELVRKLRPNVLRQLEEDDLDESTFQKILQEDLVDLSPEAKEMLLLMRQNRRKERKFDANFQSLLSGLEEFRQSVEDLDDEEDEAFTRPGQPFMPPQLILNQYVPRPDRPRSRSRDQDSGCYLNEAGELARKMVVYSPSPELRDQLASELQVFGSTIVGQVKQFGVRAIILEQNRALPDLRINNMMVVAPSERTHDGRPWSEVRGLYCAERRLFVVGEEMLGLWSRSVARHEFAHAYDHVFSEKNHRRMPLSVQLWNSFRGERTGVVSDYAASKPAEYFAESVEAFFQAGACDVLRQQDPQMYNYLEQLFAA